jgi:hypothetical protein
VTAFAQQVDSKIDVFGWQTRALGDLIARHFAAPAKLVDRSTAKKLKDRSRLFFQCGH